MCSDTPDGPVLCDFSYAGPDVAWLETVSTAASFNAPNVLPAYLEAGESQLRVRPVPQLAAGESWVRRQLAGVQRVALTSDTREVTDQNRVDEKRPSDSPASAASSSMRSDTKRLHDKRYSLACEPASGRHPRS